MSRDEKLKKDAAYTAKLFEGKPIGQIINDLLDANDQQAGEIESLRAERDEALEQAADAEEYRTALIEMTGERDGLELTNRFLAKERDEARREAYYNNQKYLMKSEECENKDHRIEQLKRRLAQYDTAQPTARPVMCQGICTSQLDDYCGMHMSNETCPACDAIWTQAHLENEQLYAQKYTCGECYTVFDRPADGKCPTCRIREIVPIPTAPEDKSE